jgi:hypothetical protein
VLYRIADVREVRFVAHRWGIPLDRPTRGRYPPNPN